MMKTRLNRALATCLVFAMMLSIMSVCAGAVSDPSAPEAKVQMSNTEVQANNDATMDAKALLQEMEISGDVTLEERIAKDLALIGRNGFPGCNRNLLGSGRRHCICYAF